MNYNKKPSTLGKIVKILLTVSLLWYCRYPIFTHQTSSYCLSLSSWGHSHLASENLSSPLKCQFLLRLKEKKWFFQVLIFVNDGRGLSCLSLASMFPFIEDQFLISFCTERLGLLWIICGSKCLYEFPQGEKYKDLSESYILQLPFL